MTIPEENRLTMSVTGGLCRLVFHAGGNTGIDPDTNPGVSFTFISETPRLIESRDGTGYYGGMGVIGRKDAQALKDLLSNFLAEYPAVREAGDNDDDQTRTVL